MDKLLFYTRPGCGLCVEAKDVLLLIEEDFDLTVEEINIDEQDQLTEKYGLMIPVVEYRGEIVQFGNIDYFSLSKRLQARG
ncbi:glutaredoxin [Bacillus coahuilensis m2-6]|uniref:Glutaredoxin n=1 Tax=Bacillus coahuilensis p1.1.43 TaxID=1150625 RepID=A0A147K5V7_9BACI|nr:glutaredoxin family protein [Bacillus coahuilensis]KUP05195.1 glutaredoxin [Bacillus coahuilensis p1.1.43]KUP05645.1 glutaredoxin [Bacillus coahuilensis m2-6]